MSPEASASGGGRSKGDGRVGILLVTHYGLGAEFIQALRLIVPDAPPCGAVGIEPDQSVDDMRSAIAAALEKVDHGQGVLILTDMFGGTPSNISLSFHEERRVEVVTGVNLPMLIKLATMREGKPLDELARFIRDYGQRNISVASDLLPDGSR